MGVRDLTKYPEIKRLLGIPENEPIFILAAHDRVSTALLECYAVLSRFLGATSEFVDHVRAVRDNFLVWQRRNPDKMKTPD